MADASEHPGEDIVCAWIRSDACGVGLKMMLDRGSVQPLMDAISGALAEQRARADVAELASEIQVEQWLANACAEAHVMGEFGDRQQQPAGYAKSWSDKVLHAYRAALRSGASTAVPAGRTHRAQPWSDAQEAEARQVYEGWAGQPGYLPWIEGGNSDKQFEARDIVRDRAARAADGGRT